jgi:hypothetical protein
LNDISNLPNRNLDQLFATLEDYVCKMYGFKKINDINVARSTTFTNAYGRNDNEDVFYLEKGIDGSMFPPCKSELHQHFLRTSYIAHLWSHAHLPIPSELSPGEYGWEERDEKYFFKWFEGDQLPPSITSVTSLNENPQGTRMIKLLLSQCRAKMLDDMTFIIDNFFLQMTMEWKTMNINVI